MVQNRVDAVGNGADCVSDGIGCGGRVQLACTRVCDRRSERIRARSGATFNSSDNSREDSRVSVHDASDGCDLR